jgi:hypothetical protein
VTAVSPRKARRLPASLPRKPRGGIQPGRAGASDGGDEDGPAARPGPEHTEAAPDGDWVVRLVPGAVATKAYRCPGCDQEIPPGTAHLVAWPAYAPGLEQRRHWHTPCWQRRSQRHPAGRRGSR